MAQWIKMLVPKTDSLNFILGKRVSKRSQLSASTYGMLPLSPLKLALGKQKQVDLEV